MMKQKQAVMEERVSRKDKTTQTEKDHLIAKTSFLITIFFCLHHCMILSPVYGNHTPSMSGCSLHCGGT